jgi:L-lactate dehydrogenase complex protein LldG
MREEVLQNIRAALNGSHQHGASHGPAPSIEPASPTPGNGLLDREAAILRFETELMKVGGQFFLANGEQAVRDHVLSLAKSGNARSAVGWNCSIIQELGLAEALGNAGVKFNSDTGSDEFVQLAIHAGIGISGVDYALADTGSLVVISAPGRARSASLVPPIHIALVRPEQVLSDLNDLFPLLKERGTLSSAIAFITGPSRTADIEMTLVVGVHGPQQLHVILVR